MHRLRRFIHRSGCDVHGNRTLRIKTAIVVLHCTIGGHDQAKSQKVLKASSLDVTVAVNT